MVPASEVELWFVREVLPLEASLMRFLRSSYRNTADAADLRQDVYAELIETAQKQIPNPTKPFVFAVAHNIMIDRMRRERVVPMDTISDIEKLGLASDAPPPDRVVIARDELRHLRAAIEQLPPRCREIVAMAQIDELSNRKSRPASISMNRLSRITSKRACSYSSTFSTAPQSHKEMRREQHRARDYEERGVCWRPSRGMACASAGFGLEPGRSDCARCLAGTFTPSPRGLLEA